MNDLDLSAKKIEAVIRIRGEGRLTEDQVAAQLMAHYGPCKPRPLFGRVHVRR